MSRSAIPMHFYILTVMLEVNKAGINAVLYENVTMSQNKKNIRLRTIQDAQQSAAQRWLSTNHIDGKVNNATILAVNYLGLMDEEEFLENAKIDRVGDLADEPAKLAKNAYQA